MWTSYVGQLCGPAMWASHVGQVCGPAAEGSGDVHESMGTVSASALLPTDQCLCRESICYTGRVSICCQSCSLLSCPQRGTGRDQKSQVVGVGGGGRRGELYLMLHCHHQNESALKLAAGTILIFDKL